MMNLKERIRGCMLGGAAGDALGYPVEFMSRSEIVSRFGESGITEFVQSPAGVAEISDDTQMSLFTAASALMGLTRRCTRGVGGRPASYVRYGYIDWLHTQEWSSRREEERCDTWLMDVPELYARRAPGNTCLSALRAMEKGSPVTNDSCGCGGVMRTAPLACICARYGTGFEENDAEAADAAELTHKHPLGFIPAAALNHILYAIFTDKEGKSLETIVKETIDYLPRLQHMNGEGDYERYGLDQKDHLHTQTRLLKYAIELSHSDLSDARCITKIGGGWTGHEALAIAVFCALRHPDNIHEALIAAVNHSGDSDSTGAITGNIVGALSGLESIGDMLPRLEIRDVIEEIAADLASGCVIREYDPEPWSPEKAAWSCKYLYPYRRYTGESEPR